MFDFIYSEVWWIKTIIAAGITGVCGLIGGYILYISKLSKMHNKINEIGETVNAKLPGEHKGLSDEHTKLSKEHLMMLDIANHAYDISNRISGKVDAIHIKAEKEDEARKYQYESITKSQQNISDAVASSISSVQAMHTELLKLASENQLLSSRLEQSEYKAVTLTEQLKESKQTKQELIAALQGENAALKQQQEKLLAELGKTGRSNTAPKPKPPNRGRDLDDELEL